MNKIVQNTFIYTIGQILPQAAGFILLPIYTHYLSPAEYGIVNSMVVFQTIIAIFFTLCLERSIFRLYWDYKSESEKKDFLGTITISISVLSVLFLGLLFLLNGSVGLMYKSISFFPFFAYAIFSTFFATFSMVPKNHLMVKEKAGYFVTISLIQFFLNAGFILWWLIVKDGGAIGYLKGNLFGHLVMFPFFIFISFKTIHLKFSYKIFKKIASFSLPLIPAILTGWILNLSDRIFIERFFTLGDVGIYSLGYKIAGMVGIFAGSISMAYSPVFFKLANSDNQVIAVKSISRYNHIYLMVVVIFCFFVSFFAKEVIIILFNEKYREAYLFIPLISFSYLFSQAGGITGLFFQQSKKMKENMYISISAAFMNIILNFLLIPRFGVFGAAYATILSLAIPFGISYSYTKKNCYFVPIKWNQIIPLVGILVTLVALFQYGIKLEVYLSLVVKIIVVGIIGLIFLKKYYSKLKWALSSV
jgi:O-antigen/teichoic acid export membrane protein